MLPRRRVLAALGGAMTLAGCAGTTAPTDGEAVENSTEPEPDPLPPADLSPKATTIHFYDALFAADLTALNERLVHPKSPTYPLESDHVPPAAFDEFADITLGDIEEVSVQDRVVHRLYHNVSHSSRNRRAMGAERLQYVHTTFHVSRADEDAWYAVDVVDYLVRDDDVWYVRYTDRFSNTGEPGEEKAEPDDGTQIDANTDTSVSDNA